MKHLQICSLATPHSALWKSGPVQANLQSGVSIGWAKYSGTSSALGAQMDCSKVVGINLDNQVIIDVQSNAGIVI